MPSPIARSCRVHGIAVHGSLRGVRLHVPLCGRSVPTKGGESLLGLLAGDSGRLANGCVRAFPVAGLRDHCHH